MENFSTRLRKAVDMAGISAIKELAKSSGVNEHTMYSYISPERYGHNRNHGYSSSGIQAIAEEIQTEPSVPNLGLVTAVKVRYCYLGG